MALNTDTLVTCVRNAFEITIDGTSGLCVIAELTFARYRAKSVLYNPHRITITFDRVS